MDEDVLLDARARTSGGTSSTAIYEMVADALERRDVRGETLLDIGCGRGQLWPFLRHRFSRYVGVDAVRYDGFPPQEEFVRADLNGSLPPSFDSTADAVVAVETIEHLENPRHLMRSLVHALRPRGWIVITTPNQRSLLSLGTLIVKGHFSAFQDGEYPAHLTALLDVDLRRIASENGLSAIAIDYSADGRVAFTARHYPSWLSRLFPRALSDNLLVMGRAPDTADP
jgi:2-polyprenyl-3-methyl-5-hydroxy-6-metoxy-1,4-benzoquinol methylase